MTTAVSETYCKGLVRRDGQDRYCAQVVGLTSWVDVDGVTRYACTHHVGGLRRRYPTELPERLRPAGTLGLGTPWTRGKFAPADVVLVENAIPDGYRINVHAKSARGPFVVIGLRKPADPRRENATELYRSGPTADPLTVALAMCERLALECAANDAA